MKRHSLEQFVFKSACCYFLEHESGKFLFGKNFLERESLTFNERLSLEETFEGSTG